MPSYVWKNKKTGEVVEVSRPIADADLPPETGDKLDWQRVYSFGVGRVEGGASKGRASR